MDPAIDLRVPKHPIVVELELVGREARQVELFVAEHEARAALLPQDILELLESEPSFLPARDAVDGRTVVFNKNTLVWAAVGLSLVDDDELFSTRLDVRVETVGGRFLEGDLLFSPPAGRTRVTDYLNQPGRFIRLWTADRVFLLNKAFIMRVLEIAQGG